MLYKILRTDMSSLFFKVQGELHSVRVSDFEITSGKNKGQILKVCTLSLITDDQYRPLMMFTVSESVMKSTELLKVWPEYKGKTIELLGTLVFKNRKIGDSYYPEKSLRVDRDIDFEPIIEK